jgi:hypothetical protein
VGSRCRSLQKLRASIVRAKRFPKDRYQTEVESWRELQLQNIEFTLKRLREPVEGMSRPHTKSHQRSFEHMRSAAKLVPLCCPCSQNPKMLYAGQKNTQIAAPQRATNQASESQTSTSSRLTNRRLARRANRKVPVLFLLSFIACSCFIIAPARAPKWRACRLALARGLAVIPALLGTPTKPLNQQDEKASRW